MSLPVCPAGRCAWTKGETLTLQGEGGPLQVTRYDLTGIDLTPDTMLLDAKGDLFARRQIRAQYRHP